MLGESRSWAAIRSGPAAFEIHLELLTNGGISRRWGIFGMALLQVSRGAIRTIIRKIFSHLPRSDMLGKINIVVVVVRCEDEERIEVTMPHNPMPERNFFSRGTRLNCRISVNVIYWVLDIIEYAGRGQIGVWQSEIQAGFRCWSLKGRLPRILYRLFIFLLEELIKGRRGG